MKKFELILQEPLEKVEDFAAVAAQAVEEESGLEGILVEHVTITGREFTGLEIHNSRFRSCRIQSCDFSWASFSDVILEDCDWSGSGLNGSFWSRCCWIDSKGVGTDLHGSFFQHTGFYGCGFSYANLSGSTLKQVDLEKTDLTGAFFSQCRWKELSFSDCRLSGTSFFQTAMGGLDLTSCHLEELVLSDEGKELKGVIVDYMQAAELARRLGVVIRL